MSLSLNYINKTLGSVKKTFGAHHIVDLKVLCLLLSKVSIDDNKIKKKKLYLRTNGVKVVAIPILPSTEFEFLSGYMKSWTEAHV